MADIPVRPAQRGTPWWLWALLLLAVAAVAAFFLLDDDDDELDEVDDTEVVATPPPATTTPDRTPVVRLDSLPDAADARVADYEDRSIDLAEASVVRALGDSAFTVRSESGREIAVVLDEPSGVSTAGSASGFTVAAGDRVRLSGTLRRAVADLAGVPEAARTAVSEGALYIAASAADVVNVASMAGATDSTDTNTMMTDTTRTN